MNQNADFRFLTYVVCCVVIGCFSKEADQTASTAPAHPAELLGLSSRPESHQKMVTVLRKIADKARRDHPYLGDNDARQLRQQVLRLGPGADPFQFVYLHSELGQQELKIDNIDEAIRHLEMANQGFKQVSHPDPKVKQRFRNRLMFTLGTAYIRLGETQNCCAQYTSDSCIVPIQPGGIHTNQTGSRRAVECFMEVLKNPTEDKSEHVQVHEASRWLLNIAWMTLGEYPASVPKEFLIPPEFFESTVQFPRFRNIYPQLGLTTNNLSGGVAVDDFNGDGHFDIFTCSYDPTAQTQYFRNNGDGTFTERTHEAGLTGIFGGLNLVHADYDNDGDLDVFICRGAWLGDRGLEPNSLLRNDGEVFTDVTFDVGLGDESLPCKSAAWGDYDNDGDLDLFVGNESDERLTASTQLFRNDGAEEFTDVSQAAGLSEQIFVMGAVWGDYNNDRYPDLYVSVGGPNRLYRNNRDGTFTDVAKELSVDRPLASFPTWFWDYNNDGHLDLFVSCSSGTTGILSLHPFGLSENPAENVRPVVRQIQEEAELELMALYKGDGLGGFENVSRELGLTYPALPMGANFGDLNNDGYLDFYLGTGDVAYSEVIPNVMFLNQQAQSFANVTMAGGFGHLQKGHGVAFADLDHDGDQDVYMQMGGAYASDKFNDALYLNPGFGHHWLGVQLTGTTSNRCAIGAQIRIDFEDDGHERSVYRTIGSGGSFGCNPLRESIGIGKALTVRRLEVYWPTTDQTQVFEDVAADQLIRITEGRQQIEPIRLKRFDLPPKTFSETNSAR